MILDATPKPPPPPSVLQNILLNLGNQIETLHTGVERLLTNRVCVVKQTFLRFIILLRKN